MKRVKESGAFFRKKKKSREEELKKRKSATRAATCGGGRTCLKSPAASTGRLAAVRLKGEQGWAAGSGGVSEWPLSFILHTPEVPLLPEMNRARSWKATTSSSRRGKCSRAVWRNGCRFVPLAVVAARQLFRIDFDLLSPRTVSDVGAPSSGDRVRVFVFARILAGPRSGCTRRPFRC